MSSDATGWIDPLSVERFRAAGRSLRWQEHGTEISGLRIRTATLRDEFVRVEETVSDAGREMVVDSSPVGALVLVLEIDRAGPPAEVAPVEGGLLPEFPDGALRARWRSGPSSFAEPVPAWKDVVGLARYALR